MKIVLTLITLLVFCTNTKSQFMGLKADKTILTLRDSNYWKKVSAVDFIDTLISYGKDYTFRIEVGPPTSWYNKKCIKRLKKLRSDSVYSASVITPLGEEFGELFCGPTTISQEINHLIEGIRNKRYPYYRSSSCFYHPNERKKKIY